LLIFYGLPVALSEFDDPWPWTRGLPAVLCASGRSREDTLNPSMRWIPAFIPKPAAIQSRIFSAAKTMAYKQ
jgi:hypothetical protein